MALSATPSGDGVVRIPGIDQLEAFGIASVNVGSTGTLEVLADTGIATLPLEVTVCQTNPTDGVCLETPADSVTSESLSQDFQTHTVFARATGDVPLDPAANRIRLVFLEGGVVRGITSVAVTTDAQ